MALNAIRSGALLAGVAACQLVGSSGDCNRTVLMRHLPHDNTIFASHPCKLSFELIVLAGNGSRWRVASFDSSLLTMSSVREPQFIRQSLDPRSLGGAVVQNFVFLTKRRGKGDVFFEELHFDAQVLERKHVEVIVR
jgi:hypothetical protein